MKEATSDLGENGKHFNEFFSRQRRKSKKDTKIEKHKTYVRHTRTVHLPAAQESILCDPEELNLTGVWPSVASNKWGLLSAQLTKATGSEIQNGGPWESSGTAAVSSQGKVMNSKTKTRAGTRDRRRHATGGGVEPGQQFSGINPLK